MLAKSNKDKGISFSIYIEREALDKDIYPDGKIIYYFNGEDFVEDTEQCLIFTAKKGISEEFIRNNYLQFVKPSVKEYTKDIKVEINTI